CVKLLNNPVGWKHHHRISRPKRGPTMAQLISAHLSGWWEKDFRQYTKIFFRESATTYREGPYRDFALQVLTEFEITEDGRAYSGESVIKALTLTRSGRSRRRHGGQK